MTPKLRLAGLVFLLLASLLGTSASAAAAGSDPSFSLSASNSRPAVNKEFQVSVQARQLTDAYGYEVQLSYDPAVLELAGMEDLNDGYSIEPIVKGSVIRLAHTAVGNLPGRSGNATLAKLTFKTLAKGATTIGLTGVKLVNSQLAASAFEPAARVTVNVGATTPTEPSATPSPEPSPTPTPTPKPPSNPSGTPIAVKSATTVDPATGVATSTVDAAEWQKALAAAQADPTGKTVIRLETGEAPGAREYALKLPSDSFGGASGAVRIELVAPTASVAVTGDLLRGSGAAGDIEFRLGQADSSQWQDDVRQQVGNRPAVTFGVQAGGRPASLNASADPAIVRIPYRPTPEELNNPEHLVVWSIDEAGPGPSGAERQVRPGDGNDRLQVGRIRHLRRRIRAEDVRGYR